MNAGGTLNSLQGCMRMANPTDPWMRVPFIVDGVLSTGKKSHESRFSIRSAACPDNGDHVSRSRTIAYS